MSNRPKLEYPTQEFLKEKFDYNKETGQLVFKKHRWKSKIGKPAEPKIRKFEHNRYLATTITITYKTVKSYYTHRLIWIWHNGSIPDEMEIDHINNQTRDNRIENLQLLNPKNNIKKKKLYKQNTSGYTGITFRDDCRLRKWYASISINKKRIFLGAFKTKEEAITARLEANKKYGFAETHGQKIP